MGLLLVILGRNLAIIANFSLTCVEDSELRRLSTYVIGVAQYIFLAILWEIGDFKGKIGDICQLLLTFR